VTQLNVAPKTALEADLQPEESTVLTWRPRRWMIAAALAVLVAAVVGTFLFVRDHGQTVQYTTELATRGNLIATVTATGTLQPTNQVEIGTEISGRIERVKADYNDVVKVGQVLARLDTSRLEAQVQQSQAALESAQAKVLQAQASVDETTAQLARLTRMRELTSNTIPSQSDLDAAVATRARAEADGASARALVAQSRATLHAQRTDLAKAVIRSPIDGLVLKRSVEPGQTVAATLQAPVLFVLAENLAQMELHVDVDEADVSAVQAGQRATFTVDAHPDRQFSASVAQVHFGAQTVSGVVTYETVLTLDNSSLELRPGMTATAEIVIDEIVDALLVPNAALRFNPPAAEGSAAPSTSGGLVSRLMPRPPGRAQTRRESMPQEARQVWTLRNGQPVALLVQTGATDGYRTQILDGDLQPGTALIVDSDSANP
jgi:HlyD family secretion protein